MDTAEVVYSRETSDAAIHYAESAKKLGTKALANTDKSITKQILAIGLCNFAIEFRKLAKHYAKMVGMLESAEEDLNEEKVVAAQLGIEVTTLTEQLKIAEYQRDDLARIIVLGCTAEFEELLSTAKEIAKQQNG